VSEQTVQNVLDLGINNLGSTVEQFRTQFFALAEHGAPQDLFLELYDAFENLLTAHQNPPKEWLQDYYNEEEDEIHCPTARDDLEYWHLYRTRVAMPGKPAGVTDRLLESSALDELGRDSIDPKVYAHYSPASEAEVRTRHDQMSWIIPQELSEFYTIARRVHTIGARIFSSVLYQIEQEAGSNNMAIRYFNSTDIASSPLRVLGYYAGYETMARGHLDKGFGTVALNETTEGLRIGEPLFCQNGSTDRVKSTANLRPVVRPDEYAAVFLGKGFRDTLQEQTGLEAAWHDVTSSGEDIYSDKFQRLAAIFFANSAKSKFTKDKSIIH